MGSIVEWPGARCARRVAGRSTLLLVLLAIAPGSARAQEDRSEPLADVLGRAEAEHWMVRITTVGGEVVTGRIRRATSTRIRLQSPDTTIPVTEVARVQHGRRDESDPRSGTGLAVAGALGVGAGFLMLSGNSNIWLIAAGGVVAIAALVWYALGHEDESTAALVWRDVWPDASAAGERAAPADSGILPPR